MAERGEERGRETRREKQKEERNLNAGPGTMMQNKNESLCGLED